MSNTNNIIKNAIDNGIIKGISVALENECYRSALILIYAGIDSMATLGMPDTQQEVKPKDFIDWADKYIKLNSEHEIKGEEFYAARCALLHNFGLESKKTREGNARIIGYQYKGYSHKYDGDPIIYKPDINIVVLHVLAFADAFLKGVDDFFSNLDNENSIISKRIESLLISWDPLFDNFDNRLNTGIRS